MTARQPDPRLSPGLAAWLDAHAGALDDGSHDAAEVLPRLAEAGVFRLGVPAEQGGAPGTDIGDAIEAVSQVAEHSV
ncbi:acyl-CoA dehydrogenase, partial [Achromobacter xylosoxidans]